MILKTLLVSSQPLLWFDVLNVFVPVLSFHASTVISHLVTSFIAFPRRLPKSLAARDLYINEVSVNKIDRIPVGVKIPQRNKKQNIMQIEWKCEFIQLCFGTNLILAALFKAI